MKIDNFMPDGSIYEETIQQRSHYVKIALNEVSMFIRKGKCVPVVDVAESVDKIDMDTLKYIGYEGATYDLYEDDGISRI